MLSQCYSSPTVWVAIGTAVVDLLCVEPGPIIYLRKDQEAYTERGKGQVLWCFGRDPNSSFTDVTRSDRLNGNVSVTYITLVPWRRSLQVMSRRHGCCTMAEGPGHRLGSSAKAWINAVHLLPLILPLWSVAAGCNNRMPMSIGSFSYTWSGLVSLARSQFVGHRRDVSVPSFREQGLHM